MPIIHLFIFPAQYFLLNTLPFTGRTSLFLLYTFLFKMSFLLVILFPNLFSYLILCLILILCRNAFPAIYNTDQKIKELASIFIFQTAIFLPVNALIHNCYFTVRTGGKTFITFLFDSVFTWVFLVPSAFILVRYTNLSIITIYLLIKCWDLLKASIGLLLVHKGVWLNCMVQEKS